jgi:hypothetical protein
VGIVARQINDSVLAQQLQEAIAALNPTEVLIMTYNESLPGAAPLIDRVCHTRESFADIVVAAGGHIAAPPGVNPSPDCCYNVVTVHIKRWK